MTKKKEIKYGIEITKPHSTAIYDHNDMVAEDMKRNITSVWADEMIKFNKTDEWPSQGDSKMHTIQSSICATGFGDGFTIDEVHTDFMSNLSNMANWQLHEEYSYLQFKGLVPRTHFMMIGFNTQEWPAGTPINYDYTNANEISPFSPEASPKAVRKVSTDGDMEKYSNEITKVEASISNMLNSLGAEVVDEMAADMEAQDFDVFGEGKI